MDIAYVVAAVIIIHFVVGVAYLVYKISSAQPAEKKEEED